MQYRTMPKSDEKLSVLGFGCMRMPTAFGGAASSLIKKEEALKQIRMAIDGGVNYLDTAYPYHMGASESFLGEYVLKDGYREKVNIATKLPCMMINKADSMEQIFRKQQEKLQTRVIDYYLLHSLDGNSWQKMKSLGIINFMDKIRKEGMVRHMGFSFHGRKEDFLTIVDEYEWEFAQVQYNIIDEHFQAGIEGIEYAAEKGMGIIVMEPLRGGSLVDRIPRQVQHIYDQSGIQRSSADWALRWVLNNPAVTLLLSGMNREDHIRENIRIAEESLPGGMSEKELHIVESVKEQYRRLLTVGCTGCAYCMPCPTGIDIPSTFKNLNNFHMFSKLPSRMYHAMFSGFRTADGAPHWTTSCIDCGKCETKCPQNLPIRSYFPQVQKELEGPGVKAMSAIARKLTGKNRRTSKES